MKSERQALYAIIDGHLSNFHAELVGLEEAQRNLAAVGTLATLEGHPDIAEVAAQASLVIGAAADPATLEAAIPEPATAGLAADSVAASDELTAAAAAELAPVEEVVAPAEPASPPAEPPPAE